MIILTIIYMYVYLYVYGAQMFFCLYKIALDLHCLGYDYISTKKHCLCI